jgi:hypothetical protein
MELDGTRQHIQIVKVTVCQMGQIDTLLGKRPVFFEVKLRGDDIEILELLLDKVDLGSAFFLFHLLPNALVCGWIIASKKRTQVTFTVAACMRDGFAERVDRIYTSLIATEMGVVVVDLMAFRNRLKSTLSVRNHPSFLVTCQKLNHVSQFGCFLDGRQQLRLG